MATLDYTRELTGRFFEWEARGRGRKLHSSPVSLEPPFRSFSRQQVQRLADLDDGRRGTLLSWLVDLALRRKKAPVLSETGEDAPAAWDGGELAELELHLQRDLRITREVSEGFLQSLLVLKHPLAFEVMASSGAIRYGVALHPLDRPALSAGLHAFLPEVSLGERVPLAEVWRRGEESALVLEFALSREFMVPLGTAFSPDPLLPFLGLLSQVGQDELAALQVLLLPTRKPWKESIIRALRTPAGQPFFADAPEVTKQAEEKVSSPLFAVVVRLAVKASSRARLFELARLLGGMLSALGRDNQLLPLTDNDEAEADFLSRRSHRSGMLLSLRELALLVHLPDSGSPFQQSPAECARRRSRPRRQEEKGSFLASLPFKGSASRSFNRKRRACGTAT